MSKTEPDRVTPPARSRARIVVVLPVAAIILISLVIYRQTRPPRAPGSAAAFAATVRAAPLFELYDQHSRIVRLQSYMGRHKLLVVFVKSPQTTASPKDVKEPDQPSTVAVDNPEQDESLLLQTIRGDYEAIQKTGAVLFVISDATPWKNRLGEDRERHFPFEILSDLDGQVHRQWGAYDTRTGEIMEGICVVDRTGWIRQTFLGPDALGTTAQWTTALESIR